MKSDESIIITRQYIAFFVALILFIPFSLLSVIIFHTMKYGMIISMVIMLYIGISSITNRVSILRPKGRMEYSKGKEAVVYGVLMLVGAIINIIFFLIPLSDRFFKFW
jgi:hypothetical protein